MKVFSRPSTVVLSGEEIAAHNDNVPPLGHIVQAPIAVSQTQIDEEIKSYEDAVLELRSRRNDAAYISVLPPEVMSIVFFFCVFGKAIYPDVVFRPSLDWVIVAHICRRWRAVALGCSSLWRWPVFAYPRWAKEMLQRAKTVPLWIDVDLTYLSDEAVEVVGVALRRIDYISHLCLSFTDVMRDKLLGNLTSSAPILQSLRLVRFPWVGSESTHILPSNFLGDYVPRLRKLELVRCPIQWESPLFANLSRLVIVQVVSAARPSIAQITDILCNMPELEDLELENCAPKLALGQSSILMPIRVVNLHHLSRLSLSSHGLECANLMNHLSFPSDATLRLTCVSSTSFTSDITPVFPSVARWLNSAPKNSCDARGHIEWLTVIQPHSPRLCFVGSSSVMTDIMDPDLPTVPHMEITLSSIDWGFNLERNDVMVSFCRDLPLPRLQVLDVSVHFSFSSRQWVEAFGSLQYLHTICLRSSSVTPLIIAIGMTDAERVLHQGTTTANALFFPGLHSLIFDDTDFEHAGEDIFEVFEDGLMFRIECNAAIESLNFRQCRYVFDYHVERFGKLVVQVIWDHYWEGVQAYEGSDVSNDSHSDRGRIFGDRWPGMF